MGELTMSSVDNALCRTRNRLYEEYERATLKRIARRNGSFALMKASKLERLDAKIEQALRELRKHEQIHRCH